MTRERWTESNWFWSAQQIRAHWRPIAVSVVLVALGTALALADPFLLRVLIDVHLPRGYTRAAMLDVALIVVACLLRHLSLQAASVFMHSASQRQYLDLRTQLLLNLSCRSPLYVAHTRSGQTIDCFERSAERVAEGCVRVVVTSTRLPFFILLNVLFLLHLSRGLTVAMGCLVVLFVASSKRFDRMLRRGSRVIAAATRRGSACLVEYLHAFGDIHLYRPQYHIDRLQSYWNHAMRLKVRQRRREFMITSLTVLQMNAAGGLLLCVGSLLVLRRELSVGALVAAYTLVIRLFDPLEHFIESHSIIQQMYGEIDHVRQALRVEHQVHDTGSHAPPRGRLRKGIVIDRVSLSYQPGQRILRDVSIALPTGEHTALVGPSGSGKSSLARLLVRYCEPDSGRILIDDRPLKDYTLKGLRTAVSFVPQRPVFFTGSFLDNLMIDPEPGHALVQRAVETAQFAEVLGRLAGGLHARIGSDGCNLSGGERQRLAIARALVRNPAVLILDEAASAVDLGMEQRIMDALRRDWPGMTVMTISHRLQSIVGCDKIHVLNGGVLAGTGSHVELCVASAIYREMFAREAALGEGDAGDAYDFEDGSGIEPRSPYASDTEPAVVR